MTQRTPRQHCRKWTPEGSGGTGCTAGVIMSPPPPTLRATAHESIFDILSAESEEKDDMATAGGGPQEKHPLLHRNKISSGVDVGRVQTRHGTIVMHESTRLNSKDAERRVGGRRQHGVSRMGFYKSIISFFHWHRVPSGGNFGTGRTRHGTIVIHGRRCSTEE